MGKAVTEEYSELMHYTTAAGLTGIVSSGALWTTDASFLNDAEELKHFFDVRLIELVRPEVLSYVVELARIPANARQISSDGGVEHLVEKESLLRVEHLREATMATNRPHVFSMSASTDDRIRRSGLLSQWRGYGADGGYALVFDTVEFQKLLEEESGSYHYQHLQWGDVYYYGIDPADQPSGSDVQEFEEQVRHGIAGLLRGRSADEVPDFYQAITSLSCLYKHRGFWEEREVRVIAIPASDDVANMARMEGETRDRRTLKTFVRAGAPVPYLELFGKSPPARLPIKQVIVGPHSASAWRRAAVERLLAANGYDCEIVCSDIPYIGR